MTNSDPSSAGGQYDWQNPNLKTFDFGRVLGRAFTGIFANFKLLAIAIVISLVISIFMSIISNERLLSALGSGSEEDITAAVLGIDYWFWVILASLPGLFLTLWVQIIVVQSSYAEFTKTPQQSAFLTTSLKFLLPMFVIALIYGIVCYFGFILFLIGFIFVWPGWALAGPI